MTSAASEDRRQGREACRGAVDLALDLEGDVSGVVGDVFRRMGRLHRRRRPNGVILGGNGDGEDARLGDDGGVTPDDGLQPA